MNPRADEREADVIVTGAGILARFATLRAKQRGMHPLMVGTGEPFERFLLLHENALRVLERTLGVAPGHPLMGIEVLDATLKTVRTFPLAAHGYRLHAMRYSDLLGLFRRAHAPNWIEARIRALRPDGTALLEDGTRLRARTMIVNTIAAFARRRLRYRHGKVFRMAFVPWRGTRDRVLQINDRGVYAALIPMGEEAAVVHSGATEPLRRLLGGLPEEENVKELRLETWCGWRLREGRIAHVGEAHRRVHPHTGQGLNRALDTVDALLTGRNLIRERLYDCLMWLGGITLDLSWGTRPWRRDAVYALLDTSYGRRLLSGTAFAAKSRFRA